MPPEHALITAQPRGDRAVCQSGPGGQGCGGGQRRRCCCGCRERPHRRQLEPRGRAQEARAQRVCCLRRGWWRGGRRGRGAQLHLLFRRRQRCREGRKEGQSQRQRLARCAGSLIRGQPSMGRPDGGGQSIPVRVEIMGAPKCRNVGKSQPVLIVIDPIISTRTRMWTRLRMAARTLLCWHGRQKHHQHTP
jgi:hypothetical protein